MVDPLRSASVGWRGLVLLAWLLVASACAGGGDASPDDAAGATPVSTIAEPAPNDSASTDRSSDSSPAESSDEPASTVAVDDAVLVGYADDARIADEALEVLATIASADADDVLTPTAQEIAGDEPLLPAGASLDIRRETWERTGRIGAVVVEVDAGQGPPDEFVAFLVATADGWRLSHTERVEP